MEYYRRSWRARALATAATAGAALLSTLAQSDGAALDTARVEITGSIPPTCAFTTLPTTTVLGELATGAQTSLGPFGFTCNLEASGAVQLTVQSANGALKRDGGTDVVQYEVIWNIQGNPNASGNAAAWLAPFSFTLLSGSNGAEQLGDYAVKIVGSTDALLAGDYKDTITYTISP